MEYYTKRLQKVYPFITAQLALLWFRYTIVNCLVCQLLYDVIPLTGPRKGTSMTTDLCNDHGRLLSEEWRTVHPQGITMNSERNDHRVRSKENRIWNLGYLIESSGCRVTEWDFVERGTWIENGENILGEWVSLFKRWFKVKNFLSRL